MRLYLAPAVVRDLALQGRAEVHAVGQAGHLLLIPSGTLALPTEEVRLAREGLRLRGLALPVRRADLLWAALEGEGLFVDLLPKG